MFHKRMSRKRQLRSHSWMLSRKSLRPQRSNSGMWSRSPTHQSCPLWRNWQRPPRLSHRTGVQQSSMEQTIANPAISLAEKTVEMPVTRTQEKTQHVVNTHVQHAVKTVRGGKPVTQEKINQVTKYVEIPQLQIVEKTTDLKGPDDSGHSNF